MKRDWQEEGKESDAQHFCPHCNSAGMTLPVVVLNYRYYNYRAQGKILNWHKPSAPLQPRSSDNQHQLPEHRTL